jgi:ankyrin repeat protein
MMVRALLMAGADPAQLDSNDDTPLSRAAREMASADEDAFWEIGHWLQPLSRGVDVHRKNKQGRSVEDYLATILEDNDRPDLEPISELLTVTLAEDGKSVKRGIRWPQ